MNKRKRLIYVPLGGAGEIGMNMYLYGYGFPGAEDFILVDVGVSFPNIETTPGVDLIMPETGFVEKNHDRLHGIFITHAHEDHIGALGYLFPKIKAAVYCRKFTAAIATKKMNKAGQDEGKISIVETYPKKISAGPFKISFLPVSHSIPEASSLVIDTPIGRILHTGDFKIDKTPVLGDPFNERLFEQISKTGILALVCDSTNVFSTRHGRSESSIKEALYDLIQSQKGLIVATTFASNIARVLTLAQCAHNAGRQVLVLGRAMQEMIATAKSAGILERFPNSVSINQMSEISRSNLFIIATGSQGEKRAASAQLAREKYMNVMLKDEDCFLFSSKTIPGNELAVSEVINNLIAKGISVFDDNSDLYHVSGHANRPDLEKLHKICKPKIVIPMHGENRHLREHYNIVRAMGLNSIVVTNGCVLQIMKNGKAIITEEIFSGLQYLDGRNLIGFQDGVIKTRLKLASQGHVSVSVLLEEGKLLRNGIWVKSKGLPLVGKELLDLEFMIEDAIVDGLSRESYHLTADDQILESDVQRIVNKICKKSLYKRPVTTIFINRLE